MQTSEGEKRDATPDLFLKHLDVILATYKRRQTKYLKHVSETLVKTREKKHFTNIHNIQIKHLQHTCGV
jgi:hypothetical protein